MELGKLKPIKKPSKIRKWLSNASELLAGRYVKDCHPAFMTYIQKNNIVTASVWNEIRTKRMKKIWKLLNSKKYKKFFYTAVGYKPSEMEHSKPEVKWYIRIFDKIVYGISKIYVFIFEHELYKKIKYFEKVSASVADLSSRVDKYIASTTFPERLSRMQKIGVISNETFHDDFDILIHRMPVEAVEGRRAELNKAHALIMTGKPMKLPDDVLKIIREK